MWAFANIEDIESDLSAIHRVDDVRSLSSRRFFSLAERLAGYDGVLRRREETRQAREAEEREGASSGARTPASRSSEPRTVSDTVFLAQMSGDPGWVERG